MLALHELLGRCASNRPRKIAYYWRDEARTWLDIDQRSTRFASALRELGVGPRDMVAILSRETFEIYEHFFAVQKLGATRVSINWRYAPPQIHHILRESRVRVLLVQAECADAIRPLADEIATLGIRVIGFGKSHGAALDYEALLAAQHPGRFEPAAADMDAPAVYTFTSGTTGKPKGVVLSYGTIAAQVQNSVIGRGLVPDDIVYVPVQSSWFAFLLNTMGVFNGMSHVIVDGQLEIVQYLRDIERIKVTAAQLAPTLILRAIREMQNHAFDLSSLRLLMYGSAPATPALIRSATQAFRCKMHQSYGSTECGWVAYLYPRDHERAMNGEEHLLRSAGQIIPQCRIAIRDDQGRDLPPGEAGEIWISNQTLMTGYLNQPDLTADVLHGEWLKTNDIGRLDEEGYLYLLDRRSFMIVTGGVNVFPASVEAILSGHASVEEVAVVGVADEEWGEAVSAAVKLRAAAARPSDADLRAYCQKFLSRPECPKTFTFVDELPRNENGKIDKAAVKKILTH